MKNLQPINDLCSLEIVKDKRVWQPFMEKYDGQVICEVGVFAGRNFFPMIAHNPKVAIAVDSWTEDGVFSHNDSGLSQQALDRQYVDFINRTIDKPFVKVYREYSEIAVEHFPDEFFDFIYIDGDHTYEGCLSDIENWYPKVKKGKFLTGDDYVRTVEPIGVTYDVKRAVNDFVVKNNLAVFEIPGNQWATGWAIIK